VTEEVEISETKNMPKKKKTILVFSIVLVLVVGAFFLRNRYRHNPVAEFVPNNVELSLNPLGTAEYKKGRIMATSSVDGQTIVLSRGDSRKVLLSTDGGTSWTDMKDVPHGGHSDLALDRDGNLFTVSASLSQSSPLTTAKLKFYSQAASEVQEVFEATELDNGQPESIRAMDLEVTDKGLFVVFKRVNRGNGKLHSVYSSDFSTWVDNGIISGTRTGDIIYPPELAAGDDELYLAYIHANQTVQEKFRNPLGSERNSLVMLRSKDAGATWKNVSDGPRAFGGPGFKTIAQSHFSLFHTPSDGLYFIWLHTFHKIESGHSVTKKELLFSTSQNGGASWANPVRFNDVEFIEKQVISFEIKKVTAKGIILKSAVSSSGNYIGVVWKDPRQKREILYFTFSEDGGQSWAENKAVFPNLTGDIFPFDILVNDRGSLHIIFKTSNGKVYHAFGQIG